MAAVTLASPTPTRAPEVSGHLVQRMADKTVHALKQGLHAVDAYSSPRDMTHGDFEAPNVVLGILSGAADGFMMLGPIGALQGAASATASVVMQQHKHSRLLGGLAAAGTGIAVVAATAALTGAAIAIPVLLTSGAVFGVYEALRTDPEAKRRDAAGGLTMFPMLLPGPTKMAACIGAGVGQSAQNKWVKAAIGAVTGAAVVTGMMLLGPAHAVLLPLVATAAIGGAIGPEAGPRIIQTLRNLSADLGKGVKKLIDKVHPQAPAPPVDPAAAQTLAGFVKNPRFFNIIGSIPVTFARSFLVSDGDLIKTTVGAVLKVGQQAWVAWAARASDSDKGTALVGGAAIPGNKQVENPAVEPAAARPSLPANI